MARAADGGWRTDWQAAERQRARAHLIDVRVSREERRAAGCLDEHAADRPHVHRLAVLRVARQQLRTAVPDSPGGSQRRESGREGWQSGRGSRQSGRGRQPQRVRAVRRPARRRARPHARYAPHLARQPPPAFQNAQRVRVRVPARGDVVGVARAGPRERARESKVAELERAVFGDEQVFGLDVAVDDVVRVAELDGAQELPEHLLD